MKKISWGDVIFWFWVSVALYIIFLWEPYNFQNRTRVCDLCVYRSLETKPKLPAYLAYADDIDYWFIGDETRRLGDAQASCSFSGAIADGPFGIFRTPDILIFIDEDEPESWQGLFDWCVFHEIGHYIDQKLHVSSSDEFHQAVELSILMWQNLPSDKTYVWQWVGEKIATFPGINGNPLAYDVWGGWVELYADLHDVNYLSEMPPPLRKYFDEFIPWSP